MNKGYVVKYSDGTYYCAAGESKKTNDMQEATVFPKVDNQYMKQIGIKHQDGWNVPMLQISQVGGVAELIEVVYDIANIRLNADGKGRTSEGYPSIAK